MPIDPDLLPLFETTVVVSTGPTSRTVHGIETYSTSTVEYPAHITEKYDFIRDREGNATPVRGTLIVATSEALSTGWRYRVGGVDLPILGITRYSDEDGAHHTTFTVGF